MLVASGFAFVTLLMSLLWVYQWRTGHSGIVDAAWASGVGMLTVAYVFLTEPGVWTRKWFVLIVTTIWATRLGLYIWTRLQRESGDGRYDAMKAKWGPMAQRNLFLFYQFQALVCVLFSLPMLIAILNPNPLGWLDGIGLAIGVVAIVGEAIADWQLSRFKGEPTNRGQVCQVGLWRYSRHPNYFFEWLHWWAYVLLAVSYPMGLINIVGPMAMLFFVLKVTGIPHTEAQAIKSRGDLYRDYQRTTSAFFPWFPKPSSANSAIQ